MDKDIEDLVDLLCRHGRPARTGNHPDDADILQVVSKMNWEIKKRHVHPLCGLLLLHGPVFVWVESVDSDLEHVSSGLPQEPLSVVAHEISREVAIKNVLTDFRLLPRPWHIRKLLDSRPLEQAC